MGEPIRVLLETSVAPLPQTICQRVARFWSSPFRVKLLLISRRFARWFPDIPVPIQLFFGSWWLARSSALDGSLMAGSFEPEESRFLTRFLKPGMTVLDVGAHHGYYTLLSSKAVGPKGKVIAFEPSPRERMRLREHTHLNRCVNVSIEMVALGASDQDADFFLVQGAADYCNSLRPPAIDAGITKVKVAVTALDDFLSRRQNPRIDFIKLDVEGAELDVLRGAQRVLATTPRPILLVEVYDIRTAPWGYAASDIVRLMDDMGYRWYRLLKDGTPEPISVGLRSYDMNLIAVPEERVPEFAGLRRGLMS
jgi:FkbM family methyltransferase